LEDRSSLPVVGPGVLLPAREGRALRLHSVGGAVFLADDRLRQVPRVRPRGEAAALDGGDDESESDIGAAGLVFRRDDPGDRGFAVRERDLHRARFVVVGEVGVVGDIGDVVEDGGVVPAVLGYAGADDGEAEVRDVLQPEVDAVEVVRVVDAVDISPLGVGRGLRVLHDHVEAGRVGGLPFFRVHRAQDFDGAQVRWRVQRLPAQVDGA